MDENKQVDRIMIIDDEPDNLNILDGVLDQDEFELSFFTDGQQAIETAKNNPPDLLLLDIRMPTMNGFEVCRNFKSDTQLHDIPILFISGLSDTENIINGFSHGAVDYITKPFHRAEVIARIRTHLNLSHAKNKLAEQHTRLKDLERQRDAAVHMLVHDMRNPLQVILSNLQTMRKYSEKLQKQSVNIEALDSSIHCTESLKRMIADVLDLRHMQQTNPDLEIEKLDVSKLIDTAHARAWDPTSSRDFVTEIDSTCPPVCCDSELTIRILANLISNAVKYSPSKSTVTIGTQPDGSRIRIWVRDQGPGILAENKSKIFNFLETLSSSPGHKTNSYGIGLAFCKCATESQGGEIGVESIPGEGSTFWIALPAWQPE